MFVYLLLLATFATSLAALRMLWKSASWPHLLAGLALSGFIFLYGAWIYLSAYAAHGFAILASAAAVMGIARRLRSGVAKKARAGIWVLLGICAIMDLLFFTGTTGKTEYADLDFPLHRGDYFVLQGGKGLPSNLFHFNSRRAVYAMDLVRVDRYGRRASRIFSKRLDDYFIFGDTIFAPCAGTVERAIDINPDNIPPERKRGPENLNGVVIAGTRYTVFLGHMQFMKVFVRAGEKVRSGQPLGLAGNSGMSIEPHLHIQVHKLPANGQPWYQQPQLFIRFGGKEYLLFQRIPTGAPAMHVD